MKANLNYFLLGIAILVISVAGSNPVLVFKHTGKAGLSMQVDKAPNNNDIKVPAGSKIVETFRPEFHDMPDESIRVYYADLAEGIIGMNQYLIADDPYDNVFHIYLDELPQENDKVWLEYELNGVQDFTAVAKSINDQQSVGGYFIQKNEQWAVQRELISVDWLQQGDNVVRFTIPTGAEYDYFIRHLALYIEKQGKEQDKKAIVINQPSSNYYNGKAYIQGFISGEKSNEARLYIGEKEIDITTGLFEAIIKKPAYAGEVWEVKLVAIYPDGTTLEKNISFDRNIPADHVYNWEAKDVTVAQFFNCDHPDAIDAPGAQLTLQADAMNESAIITVTALRDIDLPALHSDMVNVTKGASGYRFLPNGMTFLQAAMLKLDYDEERIPDGYTPDDIRIFFFNESSRRWVALPKDSVNLYNNAVYAPTMHFTDFIAGIIKVPESPETQGYKPTTIKDLKAADPSAGISSIAAPSPNNMGTANLSYPLNIPAGRQGLQPQLAINYSSEAGNGWLGLGWDINVPAISIETRWGVPRFDPDYETETYLMEGNMLIPLAHRSTPVARSSGDKRFYPRVEKAYNKIIRHGNSPKNYWWEVIGKDGTRSYYGGSPQGNVVNNAVLKDTSNGNIVQWYLREVRDLNDNFVRYHYEFSDHPGVIGGLVPGRQLYLKRITYTGHGNTEGKYAVEFHRDPALTGQSPRADVIINGRLGFKQVTADLLRRITILLGNQTIRSYDLHYTDGPFVKSQLIAIVENDKEGNDFYRHEFDYYDDVRQNGNYQPFKSEVNWSVESDGISGDFILTPPSISDHISAISGSKSSSYSLGGAGTFGIAASCGNKHYSIGGGYNYSKSDNTGLMSLIDINGDGLSDKVFYTENGLKYRPNLVQNGTTGFGTSVLLEGAPNVFSISKTTTKSKNLQASIPHAFFGLNRGKSKTTSNAYFSDFNKDGLIDIVYNGKVYFNYIFNNTPTFSLNVDNTPNRILPGAAINTTVLAYDPNEQDELITENPLHDAVRQWIAPYDGEISINSIIQLLESPEALEYPSEDGVRLAIQHNHVQTVIGNINYDDFTPHPYQHTFQVNKGDRIYFRLQSLLDGAYDQVYWDPLITYTNIADWEMDANGRQIKRYKASEDFITASNQTLTMPYQGQLHIKVGVRKQTTSDNLRFEIIHMNTGDSNPIFSRSYNWNDTINQMIDTIINVLKDDELKFMVSANTNIDWAKIIFSPMVAYTAAQDENGGTVPTINNNGDTIITYCPAVAYTMYNDVRVRTTPLTGISGTISLTPFTVAPNIELPNGRLTLSIKSSNKLLGSATFDIINGAMPFPAPSITVNDIDSTDLLFIEYHTFDSLHADSLILLMDSLIIARINGFMDVSAGLFAPIPEMSRITGQRYRGWGQFFYDGNKERAFMPINESELMIDPAMMNPQDVDANIFADTNNVNGIYDPTKAKFIVAVVDAKSEVWRGYDDLTWISYDQMSSSRMGEDDISVIYPTFSGGTHSAPYKETKAETTSVSGGFEIFGGVSGSLSYSWGHSETTIEFDDKNGDGYPDITGPDELQYTNMLGGLESLTIQHHFGAMRSENNTIGVTGGGTFNSSKEVWKSTTLNSKNASLTASTSVGISGNFSNNEDDVAHSWLDVNGDGLPDKVYSDGKVRLNLGYRYSTPPESWGFQSIRSAGSIDYGAGGTAGGGLAFANGLNLANMSFSAGISWSRTNGKMKEGLVDVNADGLPDRIAVDTSLTGNNPVKVWFNTGNGFSEMPVEWNGMNLSEDNESTGESINGAFTICACFLFVKICINPSGSKSKGVSREKIQLSDIDGDGYADLLLSDSEGELKVRSSAIGRTNLLKKVYLPLGGSIALDYNLTGNTYDLPQGKWVLTTVETNDGLPGDGVDRSKNVFEYVGGIYNRRERDFYGFQKVITRQLDTENNDDVYRIVTQTYNNNSYYEKGLLLSEVMTDADGKKYSEKINTYELRDAISGAPFDPAIEAGTSFYALTQTQTLFYEGQPSAGLQNTVSYVYDAIGNIVYYADNGDGTPGDLITASITYHDLDALYLKSIPKSIDVHDHQGRIRYREQDIDGTGNITQIRQFLETGDTAAYDMTYDAFGNLKRFTRPKNYKNQRFYFDYTYDTLIYTYVTKVQDAFGYSSSATYDYLFGQPIETIDMNGQRIVYTLDAKGRIATVVGPYELAAGKPYTILFEYYPDATVPYAKTRHYDPEHGTDILTYTFMDGLHRPIQVKKSGAIFNNSGVADSKVMIVSGKVKYDAFGRTVASYYPVTEPSVNNELFDTTFDDVPPTITQYDVLDREINLALPDGAQTNIKFEIAPDQEGYVCFKTTTTDPLDNKKESYKDLRGRERAMVSYGPNGPIYTTFRYNVLAELLKVTDHAGNEIHYTYDQLGRKLTIDHPDGGLTEFFYDIAGNLLKKITPNIRAAYSDTTGIIYTYDYGRLMQIDYPKNFQNKVVFHYGAPGAQHNRAGRIWLQEDATGGLEFFYGPLGEVVKNIRTVLVNETTEFTFVWEQIYDTWNRIQTMKYPDGEVVDYHYNSAGKLNKLTSEKAGVYYTLIEQIGYDKFEQRQFLQYGNGTKTRYSYDPNRRWLNHLLVTNKTGTSKMMDNEYEYDLVGNVRSLNNTAPAEVIKLGGPARHEYQYDNLYRLVHASGEYDKLGSRESYELWMEYDDLHNIKHKEQEQFYNNAPLLDKTYSNVYHYEGDKPHAPNQIGLKKYNYDPNGNQLGWRIENQPDYRDIYWDEENRITSINDKGYLSLYTYDAAGERVIKSHGGLQAVYVDGSIAGPIAHKDNFTVYVSPYMVYSKDKFTKHYYVESQRMASKIGVGNLYSNTIPFGVGITAGNLDYQERSDSLMQALRDLLASLGYNVGIPSLEDNIRDLEAAGISVPSLNAGDYSRPPIGWPQPDSTFQDSICGPWPPNYFGPPVNNDNVEAGYGFVSYPGVPESNQYFYHPDHLGSTNYITDVGGAVRQFAEYIPFGETFVDGHTNSDTQPYLFNAKELDAETGLYYYGARYYDPVASIWVSVDPLAEKYAGWSPYNYTLQNPVKLVDPDGRESEDAQEGLKLEDAISYAQEGFEKAKAHLNPSDNVWRGAYESTPKGLGVRAQIERKLWGALYTGNFKGSQHVEAKPSVLARVGVYTKFAKRFENVGNGLSIIGAGVSGYKAGDALVKGDRVGAAGSLIDFGMSIGSTAIAALSAPAGLSYTAGNILGSFMDSKLGISDSAAEFWFEKTENFAAKIAPYLSGTNK